MSAGATTAAGAAWADRRSCGSRGCRRSWLARCSTTGACAAADLHSQRGGIDLSFCKRVRGVAALAACGDIRKRVHHAGVRGRLIGGLVVPGMADIAKIAECVLGMPGGPVVIDRVLCLGFMTVLAGRGLGTALGLGWIRRHQEYAARDQQYTHCCDKKYDPFFDSWVPHSERLDIKICLLRLFGNEFIDQVGVVLDPFAQHTS